MYISVFVLCNLLFVSLMELDTLIVNMGGQLDGLFLSGTNRCRM